MQSVINSCGLWNPGMMSGTLALAFWIVGWGIKPELSGLVCREAGHDVCHEFFFAVYHFLFSMLHTYARTYVRIDINTCMYA